MDYLAMELLLNLFWLVLALGALVICSTAPMISREAGHVSRFRLVALVSCLLALAFPVISASDDLNALRTEMEESSSTNPSVKKLTGSNSPTPLNSAPPQVEVVRLGLASPERGPREQVSKYPCAFTKRGLARMIGCRAPPCPKSAVSVAPSTAARSFKLDSVPQFPEVSMRELQQRRPQSCAAPYGLRSFKC